MISTYPSRLLKALLLSLVAFAASTFAADTAYDGGQPTNPKDLKGKKVVLSDIPKLIGIGYFNATAKGIAEGCADLTKSGLPTEVTTDAPTEGDIQKQIEFIDNADKVESILPELQQRCCGGLIEMQETSIIVTTSEEYSTSRPRTIFQT